MQSSSRHCTRGILLITCVMVTQFIAAKSHPANATTHAHPRNKTTMTTTTAQYTRPTNVVVFIMDGKFNNSAPNPNVPGCQAGTYLCDGNYFFQAIAKTSPAPFIAKAESYMLSEWGLNVSALTASGHLGLLNVFVDPRARLRVVQVGATGGTRKWTWRRMWGRRSRKVHRYGWRAFDQSYGYNVLKPLNVSGRAGGGRSMPVGTLFAYGQSWVEMSYIRRRWWWQRWRWGVGSSAMKNGEEVAQTGRYLKMFYQSRDPIVPTARQPMSLSLHYSSSPWGTGLGVVSSLPVDHGFTQPGTIIRTVATLDGGDGTGSG